MESLVASSSLTDEEERIFSVALSTADHAALEALVTLCEEEPAWIERLYSNFIRKASAFKSGNRSELDRILEEERALLDGAH